VPFLLAVEASMSDEHDTITGQKSNDCESRIAALRQQISDSECQLQRLQHDLSDVAERCFEEEIIRLKKKSWIVTGVLAFAVSLSAGLTVFLLVSERLGGGELRNCLACLIASVLGSSTSAFISSLDRRAHGWQIRRVKIPPGSGERFNEQMVPFFVARPFLGLLTGLLVFSASRTKFLLRHESCPTEPASVHELVFYSLLAGLFAKTLIEKLKALFDKLFGG
jgi:hypothetical protein